MKPLIFVVLVLLLVVPAAAQDTYEDADGRYHFPLPSTWINKNHPDYAHFTNARGTINIYALVIAQQAVEAGISEALKVLVPGLESGPLQSSQIGRAHV